MNCHKNFLGMGLGPYVGAAMGVQLSLVGENISPTLKYGKTLIQYELLSFLKHQKSF